MRILIFLKQTWTLGFISGTDERCEAWTLNADI